MSRQAKEWIEGSASVLAFDLGAGSGRAMIGTLDGDRITLEEVHRFPNEPVQAGQHMYWDILRLLHEVKIGIQKASRNGRILSIGIDSWAVDFGLLDEQGELLGNPYHYRDHQTDGMMEALFSKLSREELFSRTGIQMMPINTIYHLMALKKRDSAALREAQSFLMIPDLLRYFLTGIQKNEFTNATTTQLFNARTRTWDRELLDLLELPVQLFAEPIQPGTLVGSLSPAVCDELKVEALPMIAVGEHDTASAVVGVPSVQKDFAYLICGTWSLLGTEVTEPVLTPQAQEWNFTNEGGVQGTYRLLKNIMGLWLLQECRRVWEREGMSYTFEAMVELAKEATPFQYLLDPDDSVFLSPTHMPDAIRAYCKRTNQGIPETPGAIIRSILEGLALKYRLVLERVEQLTGVQYEGLHMVGGGIHNELLCQYTANAMGRPVWAGPVEASALGNIAVQLMTLGKIANLQEARTRVQNSFPMRSYLPTDQSLWDEAYVRFNQLLSTDETLF